MINTKLFECANCSNRVEYWDDAPANSVLCEYCDCGEPIPDGVEFYNTRITGEPRARCSHCDWVSAYWDCPCDLVHECQTNKREEEN
jgi:DNA-directed RNA polymerase subunit RPC12/RpoP